MKGKAKKRFAKQIFFSYIIRNSNNLAFTFEFSLEPFHSQVLFVSRVHLAFYFLLKCINSFLVLPDLLFLIIIIFVLCILLRVSLKVFKKNGQKEVENDKLAE